MKALKNSPKTRIFILSLSNLYLRNTFTGIPHRRHRYATARLNTPLPANPFAAQGFAVKQTA
jgi:hypothetical protein